MKKVIVLLGVSLAIAGTANAWEYRGKNKFISAGYYKCEDDPTSYCIRSIDPSDNSEGAGDKVEMIINGRRETGELQSSGIAVVVTLPDESTVTIDVSESFPE